MEAAPLFTDVAEGPDGGSAYWLICADGLRIRLGVWPRDPAQTGQQGATKGTVLIFPGRTEYVEKYGRAAAEFQARGYSVIAIDWRGQGIAQRMLDDPTIGHVQRFTDYQLDVQAVIAALKELDLPKPWHMIGHSMGGCIGLRALYEGLPVKSAAFTAPMWGIILSGPLRPVAWTLSTLLPIVQLGHIPSPGAKNSIYVLEEPFEDNTLTNDREMWDYLGRQLRAHPEMSLGTPSVIWLNQALREMRTLAAKPAPDYPCLTYLGTNERIVDPRRIHSRMGHWKGAQLELFEDAEHEVMMEEPHLRNRVFDETTAHFDASAQAALQSA